MGDVQVAYTAWRFCTMGKTCCTGPQKVHTDAMIFKDMLTRF